MAESFGLLNQRTMFYCTMGSNPVPSVLPGMKNKSFQHYYNLSNYNCWINYSINRLQKVQ